MPQRATSLSHDQSPHQQTCIRTRDFWRTLYQLSSLYKVATSHLFPKTLVVGTNSLKAMQNFMYNWKHIEMKNAFLTVVSFEFCTHPEQFYPGSKLIVIFRWNSDRTNYAPVHSQSTLYSLFRLPVELALGRWRVLAHVEFLIEPSPWRSGHPEMNHTLVEIKDVITVPSFQ